MRRFKNLYSHIGSYKNIKIIAIMEHYLSSSIYKKNPNYVFPVLVSKLTRVSQKNGPSIFSSKEWPILNFSKIFWREIPQKNGPFIIIHIKQFGKSHFSIWFLINNFDKNSLKEWTKPDFDEIF